MKPCYVYYLVDPRTSEVRYVGVSVVPQRRFVERHLRPVATSHKENWIRELQAQGLQPIQRLICVTSSIFARELEQRLIARLANLTNATAGGDGLCNPSADVRAKMSEACKRAVTPEKRRKMSEAAKHRWAQPEQRLHQSSVMSGRKLSYIHKEKISLGLEAKGPRGPRNGSTYSIGHQRRLDRQKAVD